MEPSRLFFDPSASHGNMFFLGSGDPILAPRTMMGVDETLKRRPFFTSPDDLFEDEYYDEQLPEKKRRLTADQVQMLEKSFGSQNKLEPERKSQLAEKLGLQPRQIAVWFQNKRARWKTKQLERDYDLLKASYDALLSNYESLAKENDKLKSEALSLTEKLQGKEVSAVAPLSAQKSDDSLPADAVTVPPPPSPPLQLNVKVEDRLSSGSTGSAVVDEDSPQLVDGGGDSYFSADNYAGCIVPSEEDDGSDAGYFTAVFAGTEVQQHEGEGLGCWVWS